MARDEEALSQLCDKLGGKASYATGERRFPDPVDDDDGVAIAAALQQEFDRGADRRAALAAEQGLPIYCKAGCSDCCTIAVMIYRPEAEAIRRYLSRPEGEQARRWFLRAYPAWRAQMGDLPERLSALFVAGRQAEYDALHMEAWRKGAMCAFNEGGRCTIYPVRPIACRNAHALYTNQRCRPDSPRPAEAVAFVPLAQFLQGATRLLRATHNATDRRRHHQEPVCAAVHRLLSQE